MSDDGLGTELRALREHLEPGVAPAGPAAARRRGERRRARRRTAAVTLSVVLTGVIGLGAWALAPRPGGEQPVPPAAADPTPTESATTATPSPNMPLAALPGVWRGWEWEIAADRVAVEDKLEGFTGDLDCGWPLTGQVLEADSGQRTVYTEARGGAWSSYEVMEFADRKAAGEAFARLRGNPEYCTLYAAGGPASDPVRLLDESTVTLHQVLLEADPLYEAAVVVAWRGDRVAVLRTLLDLTSETAAQVADPDREGGGVPHAPLDAERTPHDCLAVLMADGVPFVSEEWSCPAED
ncbi:hypothetical protein SUDANB171_01346 [Streptomyces sp. enrichment culture]|uniref:hypothetical protein n=1 Tax=Streptomyces sp. enrichment culture TaxID=1795815 RepID=UPI003F542C03